MSLTKIHKIPIDQIVTDPTQPRKFFNSRKLDELAESIKEYGLLQPIQVQSKKNGKYKIVHGDRRFRAHKKAGLSTIQCIIKDVEETRLTDIRLIENIIREDLSDLELAKEFQIRIDRGETHQQIADRIGKTRAYVSQRVGLLKLPEQTLEQLERGDLTFSQARTIATVNPRINDSAVVTNGYTVTIHELEVYKLFKEDHEPELKDLYQAYRNDISIIRRACVRMEVDKW